MPSLDDQQFENYLAQFRPRAAQPLPALQSTHIVARKSFFLTRVLAAAAVVALAISAAWIACRPAVQTVPSPRENQTQPMTMHSAAALLAKAPSVQSMIESVASAPQPTSPPNGQSAIAVLSKEKIKL